MPNHSHKLPWSHFFRDPFAGRITMFELGVCEHCGREVREANSVTADEIPVTVVESPEELHAMGLVELDYLPPDIYHHDELGYSACEVCDGEPQGEPGNYNDGVNRATWCVSLWLNNTYGDYRFWVERAEYFLRAFADNSDSDAAALDALAVELEDTLRGEDPRPKSRPYISDVASLWTDLGNLSLDEVDWRSVAEDFIEATGPHR